MLAMAMVMKKNKKKEEGDDGDDDDDEDDVDDGDDDVDDVGRRRKMLTLRRMMLRRKAEPKTGKHTLCEPAQSKCTWTLHHSHFVWTFN